MRRSRIGGRRRRLIAAGAGLGLLASVVATTGAAAQEPAPPPAEPPSSSETPVEAPVEWTTQPTGSDPAAEPPADGQAPVGGAEVPPAPTTTAPSDAAPPTTAADTGAAVPDGSTTTTGTTVPPDAGTITAPAPVLGAANPFDATQGFAVLVSGDLAGGGSSAGPVAAGGDVAVEGYAVAGTTPVFGPPVGALAGGAVTGGLTADPGAAVVAGAGDVVAPATLAAPGAFDGGFEGVLDDLAARGAALANAPSTVTPTDAAGHPLVGFAAADVHLPLQPGVNLWTVAAEDLASIASLTIDGTPSADKPLVVSVTGADVTLDRSVTAADGSEAGLLWNLPDATSATVSTDLPGTLLAPRAAVTLRADLAGTLVAASLDQTAPVAIGAAPFGAELPSVAELEAAGDPADPAALVDPAAPPPVGSGSSPSRPLARARPSSVPRSAVTARERPA